MDWLFKAISQFLHLKGNSGILDQILKCEAEAVTLSVNNSMEIIII